MLMCYEDKLDQLADAVEVHVKFDSVEEAEEYRLWYKQPHDSTIYRAVYREAVVLHRRAERLGLKPLLDKIGDPRHVDVHTKYSALREAIKMCAERYIERSGPQELVGSVSIDRRSLATV